MQKHLELIEEVARKINSAAKVVNQMLLLKDLHVTRRCINLLEPETSEELWKGPNGAFSFMIHFKLYSAYWSKVKRFCLGPSKNDVSQGVGGEGGAMLVG